MLRTCCPGSCKTLFWHKNKTRAARGHGAGGARSSTSSTKSVTTRKENYARPRALFARREQNNTGTWSDIVRYVPNKVEDATLNVRRPTGVPGCAAEQAARRYIRANHHVAIPCRCAGKSAAPCPGPIKFAPSTRQRGGIACMRRAGTRARGWWARRARSTASCSVCAARAPKSGLPSSVSVLKSSGSTS